MTQSNDGRRVSPTLRPSSAAPAGAPYHIADTDGKDQPARPQPAAEHTHIIRAPADADVRVRVIPHKEKPQAADTDQGLFYEIRMPRSFLEAGHLADCGSLSELKVYLCLRYHWNQAQNNAYPSVDTIAFETRVPPGTVSKCLRSLSEKNLIRLAREREAHDRARTWTFPPSREWAKVPPLNRSRYRESRRSAGRARSQKKRLAQKVGCSAASDQTPAAGEVGCHGATDPAAAGAKVGCWEDTKSVAGRDEVGCRGAHTPYSEEEQLNKTITPAGGCETPAADGPGVVVASSGREGEETAPDVIKSGAAPATDAEADARAARATKLAAAGVRPPAHEELAGKCNDDQLSLALARKQAKGYSAGWLVTAIRDSYDVQPSKPAPKPEPTAAERAAQREERERKQHEIDERKAMIDQAMLEIGAAGVQAARRELVAAAVAARDAKLAQILKRSNHLSCPSFRNAFHKAMQTQGTMERWKAAPPRHAADHPAAPAAIEPPPDPLAEIPKERRAELERRIVEALTVQQRLTVNFSAPEFIEQMLHLWRSTQPVAA